MIDDMNFQIDHEGFPGIDESVLAEDAFIQSPSRHETRVVGKFKPKAKPKKKDVSMHPQEDDLSIPSLTMPSNSPITVENQEKKIPYSGTHMDGNDELVHEENDGGGSEDDLFDDADLEQTYNELRRERSDHVAHDDETFHIDDDLNMRGNPKIAPFVSKPTTHETRERKFCHFTKRKRRVDKVLLETPEDINPMKLKIKDLIMIAEARERKETKESEEKTQPLEDQRDEADRPIKIRLNYHTYMNKKKSGKWTKMDTDLFYQAVRQFGTDFAMIQQLFPDRTRHQIKLKFKSEERKHPLQIADAVVHRPKDHSQFQVVIDRLKALEEESKKSAAAPEADESNAGEAETQEGDDYVAGEETFEVDDWEQQEDDPEEHGVFDWTEYDPDYGEDKKRYDGMD